MLVRMDRVMIATSRDRLRMILGGVVPTTTPPLVWPSNGKNKGVPTKILNPTPMEGWI